MFQLADVVFEVISEIRLFAGRVCLSGWGLAPRLLDLAGVRRIALYGSGPVRSLNLFASGRDYYFMLIEKPFLELFASVQRGPNHSADA